MLAYTKRALAGAARAASVALPAMLLLCGFAGPSNLRFEHVSIEQGLSQESVLNILQDRQGFMWFGTQAGLNRYDGYRSTVYRTDPLDPGSLPDSFVNASFEDAEGRLWFGTKGGLARFDAASGKFVRYPLQEPGAPPHANRSVNAIAADRQGMLWLGTSDGLKRLDPASGAVITIRHPEAGDNGGDAISALAFDGHGVLWAGTRRGVGRLAPGAARLAHFAPTDGKPGRARILALSMGPRDTLWVGTEAGLEAWNLAGATPQRRAIGAEEGVGEVRVPALYHDSGGTLWAGTDLDGLKWRDPSSGRFVAYRSSALDPHSLSDNQVASVRVDRTGTLWVGSRYAGVSRTDLASGGFSHYSFRPDSGYRIGFEKARDVAVRADGKIWLATVGGGVVLLDPASGRTEQFRHQAGRPDTIPSDMVNSLRIIGSRLWLGGPGVLAWSETAGGPFHEVALAGIGTAAVHDVVRTRDGVLWVVTRGGLYQLNADLSVAQVWRNDPDNPASLGENTLFAMVEDGDGMLWIGTDNGLDRFDRRRGVFTHFRNDPKDGASLRHNRVYALTLASNGRLWIGTAGGLHRLDKAASGAIGFRYFPLTAARAAPPIGAVLEDARGQLWASMTNGISRLDPESGEYKHYTAKDGLLDGTYFVGSAARGPDGQLHFGGVNGISSFMPDAIRDNPYPPLVRITDFLVFNKSQPLPAATRGERHITLSHRESVFAFEFAALHYAAPASNRYSYRLEGFDEAWVDTDAGKRFASYTNLDPGSYVFRVRASNKDGVWSEAPAALTITITPPWWKTPWFRLLALVLVAAAAALAYRLRVRVLVQQKGVLEREVGARTAELVLQKDAAERRKREAERQGEAADEARRNIALLSDIGRRLTANLDTEAIMTTLYEHVQVLMEAPVFAVTVARADHQLLDLPYAVVDGRRCPPATLERRDPRQLATWCIEHAREVFINELATESVRYLPAAEPGQVAAAALPCADETRLPRALLYVPVVVGQRVLGAVSVQSFAPQAYQRVHLDMLRTLAAYVGVALDNAQAYRQLKEAQVQLAAQEKLASLGSLVAGVAHELNTPIGNSLLMASTLHEKTQRLASGFEEGALRRSELGGYVKDAREASELIVRSLHGAAELVNSFRQVSVDQASAQRRRFELARACNEIVATMMNKVRLAGHTLEIDVPAGIAMDSYPGPLGQVVINFVNNALMHAFEGPGGAMRLSARLLDDDWVRIEFVDDGRGIVPEHLARVFDPFFTTRMGQGGTGLGLNIAYTIVTTLLGGSIRVESAPGQGTAFVLELPLVAAEALAAQA
jgi:ligand-binding sensor domain-containing protein/signal transduction histidine kinase